MKTKISRRWLLLVGMCMTLLHAVYAQEPNTKMGKPTAEELNMTTYSPDAEASAVVLFKSTRVWYDIITWRTARW